MERGQALLPEWHDEAAYAPLRSADRAILAWEWLRRVPAYRTAYREAGRGDDESAALRWGLHRFENPAVPAPLARPMWSAGVLTPVLTAFACPASTDEAFALDINSRFLTLHASDGAQRVLLTDGWRIIRLDVEGGTAGQGPAKLRFRIDGPPALADLVLGLRRFDALVRRGDFVRSLHPPEPRVERSLRVLRAADALAAGAGQREIAAVLLDEDAGGPGWRGDHPELRLRAQRLARDARTCLSGGYRALLRRPVSSVVQARGRAVASSGSPRVTCICEPPADDR